MPMIDVYAPQGQFHDNHQVAQDLAATVKRVEGVPDTPMFRENTAAFLHELPLGHISNVDGDGSYVRVQVLTNAGALDRARQQALVEQLTNLVVLGSAKPLAPERVWVLLTEATPGGWGLWGRAHTNEELVSAARAEIARAPK